MRPLRTLGRYRRLLARYLRPEWPRMVCLSLVLFATIAIQVATPFATSRFIDRAIGDGSMRSLVLLAVLTLVFAFAGQGLAVAETYFAENVSWSATNALRADLVAHLLRLDAGFHASKTPGELIERVDGDVGTLARFFSRFVVSVVGNFLLIAGVMGLLFTVDWRIGLGLSVFVVLALAIMLKIRSLGTPYFTAERQESANFYGFVGETLTGLEDVRSSGAEPWVLRRCAEAMRSWLHVALQAHMRGYAMVATSDGMFGLGAATVLGLSVMLARDGTLTIGAVYLIFRYTDMLRQPAEQLRNEIQDFQQADASLSRVEALLATEPQLTDGPGERLPSGPLSVELEHVTFTYTDGTPVLRDLNLRVESGRVLGVVGRTGAGKTTLTRLIPRLYDPECGAVRLGGVDIRSVRLAAVRSRIGGVTQDVHLFTATLRDNLTLFDDTVSDERIAHVLDALGLRDWLSALPEGLDTVISNSGLSAGQAQLLTCARIFLSDPDIVILDEASSRLDPATERLLHEALRRLLAGRTGIIIAHRLATLDLADDILVIEDGQAREHGPRLTLANDPTSRFSELLRVAAEEALA